MNDDAEEPDFSVGSRMNIGFQSSLIKERDALKAENAKLHTAFNEGVVRTLELERENAKLRDGLTLIANGAESAVSIAKVTLREAS